MVTPRHARHTTDTGSDTSPTLILRRPGWMADARCAEPDAVARVGAHFVDAEHHRPTMLRAFAECAACAVRTECLEYAVADPKLVGVFGGTNTAARRAIRSNRQRQEAERAAP